LLVPVVVCDMSLFSLDVNCYLAKPLFFAGKLI
jgi:hypothetical protein